MSIFSEKEGIIKHKPIVVKVLISYCGRKM